MPRLIEATARVACLSRLFESPVRVACLIRPHELRLYESPIRVACPSRDCPSRLSESRASRRSLPLPSQVATAAPTPAPAAPLSEKPLSESLRHQRWCLPPPLPGGHQTAVHQQRASPPRAGARREFACTTTSRGEAACAVRQARGSRISVALSEPVRCRAGARGWSLEEAAAATDANARRFYSLPPPLAGECGSGGCHEPVRAEPAQASGPAGT